MEPRLSDKLKASKYGSITGITLNMGLSSSSKTRQDWVAHITLASTASPPLSKSRSRHSSVFSARILLTELIVRRTLEWYARVMSLCEENAQGLGVDWWRFRQCQHRVVPLHRANKSCPLPEENQGGAREGKERSSGDKTSA